MTSPTFLIRLHKKEEEKFVTYIDVSRRPIRPVQVDELQDYVLMCLQQRLPKPLILKGLNEKFKYQLNTKNVDNIIRRLHELRLLASAKIKKPRGVLTRAKR